MGVGKEREGEKRIKRVRYLASSSDTSLRSELAEGEIISRTRMPKLQISTELSYLPMYISGAMYSLWPILAVRL
jgi:hypothetical protein